MAIIEGRAGPMVDGEVYHRPGFDAELEAYHQAALHAHQQHAPVQLGLPAAPTPRAPQTAAASEQDTPA